MPEHLISSTVFELRPAKKAGRILTSHTLYLKQHCHSHLADEFSKALEYFGNLHETEEQYK